MIIGVGIDIVQNSRINKALATGKVNFLKKILTEEEQDRINTKQIITQHLAGIFAAKEAVIKSLTSYLGYSLNFQEIIITKSTAVVPKIEIISRVARKKLSNIKLTISISHEKYYSIALSIAEII